MTSTTKRLKQDGTFPDNTLEHALRERGFHVICHWQMRGPKDTAITWMEYLFASNGEGCYGGIIVQTCKDGGWNVFVEPSKLNDIEATVAAVIRTLDASVPA